MYRLILIYLNNILDSLWKIVSTHKIIFFYLFLKITITRIVNRKLLWAISNYKKSQFRLWSDFFKNICKELNFQKSCITCDFSSKLYNKYISWILTRAFCRPLLQCTSFSEHFSVDIFISINTLFIKSL